MPRGRKSTVPVEERFWSKVDKSAGPDACWPWLASVGTAGYGTFGAGTSEHPRTISSSKMAWILTYGEIPQHDSAHGYCVCHKCDNRKCCNPAHLFLATHGDNMADKAAKGRCYSPAGKPHPKPQNILRGSRSPRSKLTEDVVVNDILPSLARGETCVSIGKRLGVANQTISWIKHGGTWKHVYAT